MSWQATCRLWCRPEKCVGEFPAKSEKVPDRKIWHPVDYPEINIERFRRQLKDIEAELEKKRTFFSEQRDDKKQQWLQLAREAESLKDNFLSFNEFLNVNFEKRRRAKVNITEDRKLRIIKENEISELTAKLNALKQTKTVLDENVRSHLIYQFFLNEVIELAPGTFKNTNDVVTRYEDYVELRALLSDKEEEHFVDLQEARNRLGKFMESSNLILVGLHNQAATLETRYDDAVTKVRRYENLVFRIRDRMYRMAVDIDTTKSSIWNTYILMCRRTLKAVRIPRGDIERQLIFIKKIFVQFEKIIDLMRKPKRSSLKLLTN